MRISIWTVAIVGALAVAVSIPAAAQTTHTPDVPASHKGRTYTPNRSVEAYEACETKAHALGMRMDKPAMRNMCGNVWVTGLATVTPLIDRCDSPASRGHCRCR